MLYTIIKKKERSDQRLKVQSSKFNFSKVQSSKFKVQSSKFNFQVKVQCSQFDHSLFTLCSYMNKL